MTRIPRWLLVFGIAAISALALIALPPPATPAQAITPELLEALDAEVDSPHTGLSDDEVAVLLESSRDAPPMRGGEIEGTGVVAQDTCLHCHLVGEDKGVFTPTSRWTLFGIAGLALVFGMYRSASTWINRKTWKPLTARAVDWVDERYDIVEPLQKIAAKPVPRFARQWFYCLGGITFVLFLVQALTGIMLAVYYKPSPDTAYASIQFIETEVRFGAGIRAVHHWAANGMIVVCIAHMVRVFISGAYRAPRELNWVGGMLLLIMTLAFGFTGYLLPWDQRAFWASTVGTDIAGGVPDFGVLALVLLRDGWTVTGQTLNRFFAMHVMILPIATLALLGLHFLMIRRNGIAEPL